MVRGWVMTYSGAACRDPISRLGNVALPSLWGICGGRLAARPQGGMRIGVASPDPLGRRVRRAGLRVRPVGDDAAMRARSPPRFAPNARHGILSTVRSLRSPYLDAFALPRVSRAGDGQVGRHSRARMAWAWAGGTRSRSVAQWRGGVKGASVTRKPSSVHDTAGLAQSAKPIRRRTSSMPRA